MNEALVWPSPTGVRVIHWSALGVIAMEYHISVMYGQQLQAIFSLVYFMTTQYN